MLKVSPSSLSQDLKIAQIMEAFPDLGWEHCKTKSEAAKLAKTVTTSIVRQEVAKEVTNDLGGSDERFQKMSDAFIIKSFFTGVQELPAAYFNFVEIDPPYAIDLTKQKKDYGYEGYNEVDAKAYMDGDPETGWAGMKALFRSCYRVMADNSWGICWFGPDPWFEQIYQSIVGAGFQSTRLTCVWGKGQADEEGIVEVTSGQAHQPTLRLANAVEHFFYFWKGKPKLASAGATNHFGHRPVPPKQKYHPTQRPLPLMREILTTFCEPGAKVLVPFLGSGATLLASFDLAMSPIGYELSQNYKDAYIIALKEALDGRSKTAV